MCVGCVAAMSCLSWVANKGASCEQAPARRERRRALASRCWKKRAHCSGVTAPEKLDGLLGELLVELLSAGARVCVARRVVVPLQWLWRARVRRPAGRGRRAALPPGAGSGTASTILFQGCKQGTGTNPPRGGGRQPRGHPPDWPAAPSSAAATRRSSSSARRWPRRSRAIAVNAAGSSSASHL